MIEENTNSDQVVETTPVTVPETDTEALVPTVETTPVETTPETVPETVPDTVPVPVETTPAVETTPEEIALPPEPVEATEEPVMIAANIDEVPDDTTVVEPAPVAEPVVEIPVAGPDLGQPEAEQAETVPTFQDFGAVPVEGETTPPQVEVTPEVTPVVEQPAESIQVPLPTEQTETYQASSQAEVVPTFQQMPEAPTEAPTTDTEDITEEEIEDKPKKNKMIVPIIIVIAIIAVIGVFIYMNMTGKGIIGTKDVETLIPVRSESGNTNILVVGNDTSKKDQIYMTITGLTADELSTCPEGKDRLKYNLQEKELEVNGTKYDFIYPCNINSTINYVIDSEGDNTIDGAIVVINADTESETQAKYLLEALKKTTVDKIVIYVIGTNNLDQLNKNLRDLISSTGFDNSTPVLNGTISNIDELKNKVNSYITRRNTSTGPQAIQEHKNIKLYTHFLSKEEDGIEEQFNGEVVLDLEIGNEFYTVKLDFGKEGTTINPGDNGEIAIELDRELPLELGVRIPIYKDSKMIGLGVVSELN